MALHNPTIVAKQTDAKGARWQRLGTAAMLVLMSVVAVMLARYARAVDWREVGASIASYRAGVLAAAAFLTALSYGFYSTYDLLARTYTAHHLPKRRVAAIAAVSYAFNMNLGTIVGGAGIRYRLYMQSGLDAGTITRILGFSITTNWVGYLALAGAVFTLHAIALPPQWAIGAAGLQLLGPMLLLAACAYLVACGSARKRRWTVRGRRIDLPSLRVACLQVGLAAANWLTIGAIVFVLLREQIAFPTVMAVMLLAAIAGVLTRVPAGLGVLEVVVLSLLGGELAQSELLAALIAYRAVYYIAPLVLALIAYARFEAIAGVRPATS